MKRLVLALTMLAAAGLASADDLGDAEKALRAKEYDKAFPIFTKLANAGNAEAQFRLGEMYWRGDGTAADVAKSQLWLQKAATVGHGGAKEVLATLKQREERAADLAYWTSGYKGEDLVSDKFACPMPKFPAVSKTNEEINRIQAEIGQWETCHNDFVAHVKEAPQGAKRIPPDILKLMSPREAEQAAARVNDVLASVVTRRQAEALAFAGDRDAWFAATEKYVNEANAKTEEDKRRFNEQQQHARDANDSYLRKLGEQAPRPQRSWGANK